MTINNNFNQYPSWNSLDWNTIRRNVYNVQQRIFEASRNKDTASMHYYQLCLINMIEAKYLAVKTVTQLNRGKYTAGVDGWVPSSDNDKYFLTYNLTIDGTTDTVKRVNIPKPNSQELRPLGIPTIKDRCKQCLVKFALEPQTEAYFETHSFGFRPGRSAHDAIARIRSYLINYGSCYVFDADLKKCFDNIAHNVILNKLMACPPIFYQVDAWLKAGILDGEKIFNPDKGTPQGGVISPLLANVALDGVQSLIEKALVEKLGTQSARGTLYVRYADDFVIIAPKKNEIDIAVQTAVDYFSTVGLAIKETSKLIRTIDIENREDGKIKVKSTNFEFLGFLFKQRYVSKNKVIKLRTGKLQRVYTYVLPSPKRIARHKASITALINNKAKSKRKINEIAQLITTLNPRIKGWCNYFRYSDGKYYGDYPRKLDLWLNNKVRKWIRKNTKLRGKVSQFWKQDTNDWVLYFQEVGPDGDLINETTLCKYNSVKWGINLHTPPPTTSTPYLLNFDQYRKATS